MALRSISSRANRGVRHIFTGLRSSAQLTITAPDNKLLCRPRIRQKDIELVRVGQAIGKPEILESNPDTPAELVATRISRRL